MTITMRAVALLLYFNSSLVLACFPVPVPLAQRVSTAQWIATGQVIEKHPLKTTELTLPVPYSLRIALTDTLKGSVAEKELHIDIPNCGAGGAELHDNVLLFKDADSWYVMKHNPDTEAAIQKLLAH